MLNTLARWFSERSNCVFYAVWQGLKHGGKVRFSRSPLPGGLIRASWSPDGKTWYSYHAYGVKGWTRWQVMYRQFWFLGYVREYRR